MQPPAPAEEEHKGGTKKEGGARGREAEPEGGRWSQKEGSS